ncbi:unnamed protein product [Rotaria socialis]|uniref:EF-hand domain-containing protein n=1 Tax=Rotaria socialis TaxID=392032 RepID=A0A817QE53_9BILA|nr:unnamed protein product [Rotaria socialis]CAF4463534.1 unnamed protein product [Rotaria socialis]
MGSKPSRQNSTNSEPLDQGTINELCQDTGFSEDELKEWHRNFYKDCPDGRLTLKQFEQEYAKIMGKPTQKTADYVRHMFNVYDEDRNQFIDFKEFVMALSAASTVNRLRLIETLFHVFDLDNDGKITKEEIGKMLHTLIDVTSSNNKNHNHANERDRTKQISLQQRIDEAFDELNANDDDHITKDEFIDWYMKSGLLSDVQSEEINITGPAEIEKIGKKSRKQIKRSINTKSVKEQDETRNPGLHSIRHMSRMTERRVPSKYDDDDNDDDDYNNNNNNNPTTVSSKHHYHHQYDDDNRIDDEPKLNRRSLHSTTSGDDAEVHVSRENERWQHLFNSVLGQIRTQRSKDQPATTNETDNYKSWKREGEERLKVEYFKHKSNKRENSSDESTTNPKLHVPRTSYRRSPSPDIVTIRL